MLRVTIDTTEEQKMSQHKSQRNKCRRLYTVRSIKREYYVLG
jgi:hypothetical protein